MRRKTKREVYKKRKQQKLLTNPVAFDKLQTEVFRLLDFQTEAFNQNDF